MGTDDGRTRRDRPNGAAVTRREYDGVATEDLRRGMERHVGECRTDDATTDDRESGESVDHRIVAVADERRVDDGTIEYRPYGPYGAMALVIGFLFMLPTIFLSLVLSGIGYYYYRRTDRTSLPIVEQDVVRADVSTTDDGITVTYVMDSFVSVDADRVGDLAWPHRLAILNYATRWHNSLANDRVHRDVDDTIMGNLTAWANRNADSHVETLRSIQHGLDREFETRREYSGLLRETLPESGVANLAAHRGMLSRELTDLVAAVETDLERERT